MKTREKSGYTLVEIMIVVSIIGLLATIAIPSFLRARENSQLNTIYNNVRVLEHAKQQWALEQRKNNGDKVADVLVLSNYLKGGTIKPVLGEGYVPNPVGTPAGASLPATVGLGKHPPGSFIEAN